MSGDWILTDRIGLAHARWAEEGGHLLASAEWMNVVRALGADALFAWHTGRRAGLAIPVFRRPGLRIGFMGFPVLGAPWATLDHDSLVDACRGIARQAGLGLVRLNHCMQARVPRSASAARPEAWIDGLQAWTAEGDKRRRRDLAHARRAAAGLRVVTCPNAADCHALYAGTVRAHGGRLRYTPDYFSRLVALAARHDRLGAFGALDADGTVRAFAVLLVDGDHAHYLHGAADDVGKRMGLSDLLLERLAHKATTLGADRLSLMSSPWTQPGLARFKRKWGNASGLTVTTDVAGNARGALVGWMLRQLGRGDRRHAAAMDEGTG